MTVNAGGTLAPGTNGAGTLTIGGKLVLNTGGDYAASISNGSDPSNDRRDRKRAIRRTLTMEHSPLLRNGGTYLTTPGT